MSRVPSRTVSEASLESVPAQLLLPSLANAAHQAPVRTLRVFEKGWCLAKVWGLKSEIAAISQHEQLHHLSDEGCYAGLVISDLGGPYYSILPMATSHAASIDADCLGVGRVKHVVQRAACRPDGACRSIASDITHDMLTCHLMSLWPWSFSCPMGKFYSAQREDECGAACERWGPPQLSLETSSSSPPHGQCLTGAVHALIQWSS